MRVTTRIFAAGLVAAGGEVGAAAGAGAGAAAGAWAATCVWRLVKNTAERSRRTERMGERRRYCRAALRRQYNPAILPACEGAAAAHSWRMTAEMYQQIVAQGAAVNLSSRAKFRLTGEDRVRYLNGQVTNDVRRAKADEAVYACVTDAKGRISGDVWVHAGAEMLLLDAEAGLQEPLGMRLERYIVADDVELADVTEEWQLWHVWGEAGVAARKESGGGGQEHWVGAARFGVAGFDLWLPAGAEVPRFDGLCVLEEADLEVWRILQKVPRWPHELSGETFPPEAGLEGKAMDFSKGCYIGQEVLSRIKTTGKMPREMAAFECGAAVKAGDEVWLGEKAVGRVTSATVHPVSGQAVGLAMVRQGTVGSGGEVHVGGAVVRWGT